MSNASLQASIAADGEPGSRLRALLVFAHPDDEAVALGGRLHRLRIARLVHITDGAPRNEEDSRANGFSTLRDYRTARRHELRCALAAAGIEHFRCESLAVPDQEASLHLATLTRRLAIAIALHAPEVIFTHPFEGGHPDHDACAFAVHQAVRAASAPPLRVIECASYHAGPHGMQAGVFLPHADEPETVTLFLEPAERSRKKALLDCFKTQQETLQYFPLDHESFRIAPRYDFTQAPHPGELFYERYPWGMTGQRFCRLASQALRDLTGPRAIPWV